MSPSRSQAVVWEERWSLRAALAALAAVVLVLAAIVVASAVVGNGNGDASFLRDVDQHRGGQVLSSALQAIGLALLALPLYYLFRAAKARSVTMRGQLIGIVVAAPLFLALAAIVGGISNLHAATDFLAKGVAGSGDHANKVASDAISNAPLRPLGLGLGFAGQIGFVIAMFYTCLQAQRVGLLPRFWGSLGMALGAVSFLFFQFALLWFVYLGLLLLGRVPGGRPPAWEAGEAIPWPSPGEKAATSLESEAEEEPPELPPGNGSNPAPTEAEGPRKRKQRD
jgi:hypothetical protein